jgi:hypothetical protein
MMKTHFFCRISFLLLPLLIVVSGAAQAQTKTINRKEAYQKADSAIDLIVNGSYNQAITLLKQAKKQ